MKLPELTKQIISIDVDLFKNICREKMNPYGEWYAEPIHNQSYVVVNLDLPYDEFYLDGCVLFCVATYDSLEKSWKQDGIALKGEDFRDLSAHNISMIHDGLVTHYADGFDIGNVVFSLLCEVQDAKKEKL